MYVLNLFSLIIFITPIAIIGNKITPSSHIIFIWYATTYPINPYAIDANIFIWLFCVLYLENAYNASDALNIFKYVINVNISIYDSGFDIKNNILYGLNK